MATRRIWANALGGWRSIFRGRIFASTSPRNKEQNSPSPKPERSATSAATTSRYRTNFNLDMALGKRFRITEAQDLQLRLKFKT